MELLLIERREVVNRQTYTTTVTQEEWDRMEALGRGSKLFRIVGRTKAHVMPEAVPNEAPKPAVPPEVRRVKRSRKKNNQGAADGPDARTSE